MKKLLLILCILSQSIVTAQKISKKNNINNIAIFLQDNVEILDFAGPLEVFLVAGFNVYTVAETSDPLLAMHSLKVIPDYAIENAPIPDIVVFVGGGDIGLSKKKNIKDWVETVVQKTELQLTVCTGAFFLAEIGALDHKVATTYHQSISHLKNTFPKIDVRDNIRFVDNGKVITTAGISAGIDGALHLVSKLKGEKYATKVASLMEYDKWIPEEGLIIKNDFISKIEKYGFEHILTEKNNDILYPGEILNLAEQFNKTGNYKEAERGIKIVINQSKNPGIELYEYLRENYKLQQKSVPITSTDFIDSIKKNGIQKAKKMYNEVKKEFIDWVFVDAEDMISLAYTDYYLKGKLSEAKEIQSFTKEIFPDDAYVTYVLGVYHEKDNDITKAIDLYKKALQIDPNFVMAKDKLKSLEKSNKI